MGRYELVKKLVNEINVTDQKAKKILNILLETIIAGVSKDGRVVIKNFGTFKTRKHKERIFKSHYDGKIIKIPARNNPVFTASVELKKIINSD